MGYWNQHGGLNLHLAKQITRALLMPGVLSSFPSLLLLQPLFFTAPLICATLRGTKQLWVWAGEFRCSGL